MTLQDFINALTAGQPIGQAFTIADVLLTIILSFVLSLSIGWVYRDTYRGSFYSQSYVHTLVLMSMVVAMIMLVIGSNIARAFTLVGALSIVRFRNAIKDTRDVGFIFFAMAIGMACGTRFYFLAIIATLTISGLLWFMFKTDLFARAVTQQLLKVRVPVDASYEQLLTGVFDRFVNRADLIAIETVQGGTLTELVYSIEMKRPKDAQAMLTQISQLNANNKVVLITGAQEIDL